MDNPKVYISYAWGGESEKIVDEICNQCKENGLNVIRDKEKLGYKGSIKEFMNEIGAGNYIITVISDKYLKSENCMYELLQISNNKNFSQRIFPVILEDANIYKAIARIKYIKFWENQVKELDDAIKEVGAANLQGIRDDIDLYTEIRGTIAKLTDIIKDMNTLTPEMHRSSNFNDIFRIISNQNLTEQNTIESSIEETFVNKNLKADWGYAPDITNFVGRIYELELLQKWIIEEKSRLILILGLAGIGKTKLSVKLGKSGIGKTDLSIKIAQNIQNEFNYIVWRKLINAPTLSELLTDIVKFLSNNQETKLPEKQGLQFERIMHHLRFKKCLIVIDNVESILDSNSKTGYLDGYENYGMLFNQLGNCLHNSCVILTSREKPNEIAKLEGVNRPVKVLELSGLNSFEARKIFEQIGSFHGTNNDYDTIVELYNGNPLALELSARHIEEVYFGKIASFLNSGKPIFNDMQELLEWHYDRLNEYEKEVLLWLAINREPISIDDLHNDLLRYDSKDNLPSTIQSIQKRLPLERNQINFTIQPVLVEYATFKLISKVGNEVKLNKADIQEYLMSDYASNIAKEIKSGKFYFFSNFALYKATGKNHIRNSQIRIVIKPLIDRLVAIFGTKELLIERLLTIIKGLQTDIMIEDNYIPGNIINLLAYLNFDFTNCDFSNMVIRQAFLQNQILNNVDFTNSKFINTRFTQSFGAILSTSYSNNNELLAVGNTTNNIDVYDIYANTLLYTLIGHTDWIWALVFNIDDSILVSGSEDRTLKIWDLTNNSCLSTIQLDSQIRTVTINSDSTLIACGLENSKFYVIDVITSEILWEHKDNDMIKTVIFYPDYSNILITSGDEGLIKFWNISSRKLIHVWQNHKGAVLDLAISKNKNLMASAGSDKRILIWDIDTGNIVKELSAHSDWITKLSFYKNDNFIISGSKDSTIKIWDVKNSVCIDTYIEHTDAIVSLAVNETKNILACGSEDESLSIWNLNESKCLKIINSYNNAIWNIAYSDKSKLMAISDNYEISIYDIDTYNQIFSFQEHSARCRSICFNSEGNQLFSGSEDKTIKIWDLKKKTSIKSIQAHSEPIYAIAYNEKKNVIASGSEDNTVKIWDLINYNCVKEISNAQFAVRCLDFSPDGEYLAFGDDDFKVKIIEMKSFKTIYSFNDHTNCVRAVKFIDNKTLISSGEDSVIKIWEIGQDSEIKTLSNHTNMVKALSFNDSSFIFYSGSDDISVKIWSLNGELISNIQVAEDSIKSVEFIKAKNQIAIGVENGTIIIWDIAQNGLHKTITPKRPYEEMNITNIQGISTGDINNLRNLGAMIN